MHLSNPSVVAGGLFEMDKDFPIADVDGGMWKIGRDAIRDIHPKAGTGHCLDCLRVQVDMSFRPFLRRHDSISASPAIKSVKEPGHELCREWTAQMREAPVKLFGQGCIDTSKAHWEYGVSCRAFVSGIRLRGSPSSG